MLGIDASTAVSGIGQTGEGMTELLEVIVERLPSPKELDETKIVAMLIDSWYDTYLE